MALLNVVYHISLPVNVQIILILFFYPFKFPLCIYLIFHCQDMDILWLRNPFKNLKHQGEDMLLGCDGYNGLPYDDRNSINTGFFFVSSNNNTISFLDKWYAARNNSEGKKEQDVLNELKSKGEFHKMGIKVRYLDLEHFSGMCQTKYDAKKVTTVHANCCQTMKAKMMDLTAMLETWRTLNSTSEVIWPRHKACHDSWKVQNIRKRFLFLFLL